MSNSLIPEAMNEHATIFGLTFVGKLQ